MLQALSLAGGVTENGAMNRVRIVRIVAGGKKEIKVSLTDTSSPATPSSFRRGISSHERPVELRAGVAAEAAAGGAGRPRSGPGPAGAARAARGAGGRPAGAGGAAGRRPAPDRLREGGLQAALDGGDGVPAGDGRGHRLHVHGDADLRGADAPADRSGEPERRLVQGSHRRGSDQGRLLPDAVQHPAVARAGPQDARGASSCGITRCSTRRSRTRASARGG